MTAAVAVTGIPCPVCGVAVGEWCRDGDGGILAALTHTGRVSLALVLGHAGGRLSDIVTDLRDASGDPGAPLWECVAAVERKTPGGVRKWLAHRGYVDQRDGLPAWFDRSGGVS